MIFIVIGLAISDQIEVLFRAWFGPLAQLVEHRTFNPMVPRSSRGRPTKFTFLMFYF